MAIGNQIQKENKKESKGIKEMEQVKPNKMGSAPLRRLILSMSLPAMFSMLVQSMYNVVDSYFVAKISENALTAVSIASPVQMLMISVGVGTSIGINSLVSRRLGEGKFQDADRAATHGILLGILNWVIFALLGVFLSNFFFESMTSNPEIIDMGSQYVYIVTIFSMGMFIEVNTEKTLQATGNMIYPMVFQLIGAVTNIVLDPIFIFGLLGMPAMGIAGAAIATVAGQILAMIVSTIIIFTRSHKVHITFKGFRLNWNTIRDIYAVGFPSMIMQSIGSVLITIMNLILGGFNDTAIAVYGVYFKLQSFVFMPVFGLTHGVMPIMGYNFGAGNRKRLLSTLKIGCVIALMILGIGMVIFMVFPEQLLGIFDASEQMLEIGIPALRTIALSFLGAALGILFSTLFQAVGKGTFSLIISVLRQLVIIVPAAVLLSQIGLRYVWFAFPIAELLSLAASILLFWNLYRTKLIHIPSSTTDTVSEQNISVSESI